jgi:hypothetical protein
MFQPEVQALRDQVDALTARVAALEAARARPKKRKAVQVQSEFSRKAQKLALRFPQVASGIVVKAKTHQGKLRQVGPVFVAPHLSVEEGSLVLSRVLRCCIKTSDPAQVLYATLPREHASWSLVGSSWIKASYTSWTSELAAWTGLKTDVCEIVAAYEDDVFARSTSSLGLHQSVLLGSRVGVVWDALCPLLSDSSAQVQIATAPLAVHVAEFVRYNSVLVPVILDKRSGSTLELTLCSVALMRHAYPVDSDAPFYLATVVQLGYVFEAEFGMSEQSAKSVPWVLDAGASDTCAVVREGTSASFFVGTVDRKSVFDKSPCEVCGSTHHAGMCADKFSRSWQGHEVQMIPRKSSILSYKGPPRPHVWASANGKLVGQ